MSELTSRPVGALAAARVRQLLHDELRKAYATSIEHGAEPDELNRALTVMARRLRAMRIEAQREQT